MATSAIKAHGASVTFDGVTIGEVMSIGGSGRTRNLIRVFSCDSVSETADKLTSGKDEGQITLRLVYDGAAAGEYKFLHGQYMQGNIKTLKITYSDTSYITMQAMITNLSPPEFGDAEGSIVEVGVTFDISGAISFASVGGSIISASPSSSASAT